MRCDPMVLAYHFCLPVAVLGLGVGDGGCMSVVSPDDPTPVVEHSRRVLALRDLRLGCRGAS